jgi:O-antigen ligase
MNSHSSGGFSPAEWLSIQPTVKRTEAGVFASILTFAVTANTAFFEELTSSRLLIVLLALLVLQLLRFPRLLFTREALLYALFTGYLFVTMLWTPDPVLGLNTLFPAVDFCLIMLMYGSLVAWDEPRAVIIGSLWGFGACAVFFAFVSGFPFRTPPDFSYNANAAMYFYGLFLTSLYGSMSRSRVVPLLLTLLLTTHVVATTSIKTNFGMALGAVGVCVVYRKQAMRAVRRYAIYLGVGAAILAYFVLSSESIVERLEYGIARFAIGLEVLQAREDIPGYVGFTERQYWVREGLRLWAENPLFGHGVEAFRVPFGITSHSTPIDLLYNSGLIGFALFYGVLACVTWRLFRAESHPCADFRAPVLMALIVNVFVTLSGTTFYQSFVAGFLGISVALLRRSRWAPELAFSTGSASAAVRSSAPMRL